MGKLLGALAGTVVGIAVQAGIGFLSALVYPRPAIDMSDRAQVAESFATSPPGASVLYLASFFLAAMIGAWLARRVARSDGIGWLPAGVLAAMALVIAIFYPEPAWAQFGAFGAALIGGLLGGHLPAGVAALPEGAATTTDNA